MLQSIREKSQGWFAWTIVLAICIPFAFWGAKSYLYGNEAQNTVAKVNGVAISKSDVSRVYNQLRQQQQIQLGANYSSSEEYQTLLKKQALQSIINTVILNQSAFNDGFRADPQLVQTIISKMPQFQTDGAFSKAKFERIISNMVISPQEFINQLSQDVIINQMKSGYIITSFSLPHEINRALSLVNQERSFDYAIIPYKKFNKLSITDSQIKKYYDTHQNEFKVPDKATIQYIRLSLEDLMSKIHPTEDNLREHYQSNIASYTHLKQWKLASIFIKLPDNADKKQKRATQQKTLNIYKKLLAGQDFSTLAKLYSSEANVAQSAGLIGWRTIPQLLEQLKNPVLQLKHNGEISKPIEVDQGYMIVKLIGTKPEIIDSFEKVKEKVLSSYKQHKAESKYSDLSDQLANISYENPNSLEQASRAVNLPIQTTSWITRNGGDEQISKEPKIIRAAFSDQVLQGNNSDPVDLNDNSVVVLRVKEYKPVSVKPLSEAKESISTLLKEKIAKDKAKETGDMIVKNLKSKISLSEISKENHLTWTKVKSTLRHNTKVNSTVLNIAFQTFPAKQGVSYRGVSMTSGDYCIIALNIVKNIIPKSAEDKQKYYQQAMENNLGMLDFQLYVDNIIKQANVKRYDDA